MSFSLLPHVNPRVRGQVMTADLGGKSLIVKEHSCCSTRQDRRVSCYKSDEEFSRMKRFFVLCRASGKYISENN